MPAGNPVYHGTFELCKERLAKQEHAAFLPISATQSRCKLTYNCAIPPKRNMQANPLRTPSIPLRNPAPFGGYYAIIAHIL